MGVFVGVGVGVLVGVGVAVLVGVLVAVAVGVAVLVAVGVGVPNSPPSLQPNKTKAGTSQISIFNFFIIFPFLGYIDPWGLKKPRVLNPLLIQLKAGQHVIDDRLIFLKRLRLHGGGKDKRPSS